MSAHRGLSVFVPMLAFSFGMLSGCANSTGYTSTIQITPTSALLVPGATFQFTALAGVSNVTQFLWEVNGVVGGSPSTGTITLGGVYTAPSKPTAQPVQIGVKDQLAQATVSFFDPSHPNSGSVAATQNPLVASYAIVAPVGASVEVQFGTDTTYGLSTSAVPAPAVGGTTTILVAGMRASTAYHMQAIIKLPDGSHATDADHTFTTGAIPADILPNISGQLTGAGTASPGVELFSLIPSATGNPLCAVATDLAGNVIWYYELPVNTGVTPLKLLPNGHMLMVTYPDGPGSINDIREIDLAGNLINDITLDSVNQALAGIATFQVAMFHHDILALPNGHMILLANYTQTINNVSGIPAGTVMIGDALIDVDPQGLPVWTWSTFDHLDLTHAPFGFADWTHSNAVIYSPDDGDLILSMRNQNWVIKINYNDGKGDGSILWRFGPGGDFTLPGQEAPIDWNYGQHYPTIQSPNSSGIFSLMFFDNGNNRLVDSNNDVCGTSGVVACYSSVPIFQLNEYTKTANVLWQDNLSSAYSTCCGDALVLPSGNVEFDVAFDQNTPGVSYIEEVTQTTTPELIWRMNVTGQLAYRGFRIPSLYPGQVWPASFAQPNVRPANLPQRVRRVPPNL